MTCDVKTVGYSLIYVLLLGSENEAKPVYLGEQKRSLHVKRTGEATTSFCLSEISTTAQEICDSVVAMGETLLSCYLYSEIIVRRHRPAFFVTSNTRCTQGYYMFLKISTSHKIVWSTEIDKFSRRVYCLQ